MTTTQLNRDFKSYARAADFINSRDGTQRNGVRGRRPGGGREFYKSSAVGKGCGGILSSGSEKMNTQDGDEEEDVEDEEDDGVATGKAGVLFGELVDSGDDGDETKEENEITRGFMESFPVDALG